MLDYSEQIRNVTQYIREHINEPLNRETLAEVAGFSVPHFHHIFTATTGESAVCYVRRKRLEGAGRKLRMGAGKSLPPCVQVRQSGLSSASLEFSLT